MEDFRHKYDKSQKTCEKLRQRLQGSENVCLSQQSLIEMQANEIGKLKHKARKYKKKVAQRDGHINSLQN